MNDKRGRYTDEFYKRNHTKRSWLAIKARHRADWRRVCVNTSTHPDYVQKWANESVGIIESDISDKLDSLIDFAIKLGGKLEVRESGVSILTIDGNSYSYYVTPLYNNHLNLIFTSNLSGEFINDYNIDEIDNTINKFLGKNKQWIISM